MSYRGIILAASQWNKIKIFLKFSTGKVYSLLLLLPPCPCPHLRTSTENDERALIMCRSRERARIMGTISLFRNGRQCHRVPRGHRSRTFVVVVVIIVVAVVVDGVSGILIISLAAAAGIRPGRVRFIVFNMNCSLPHQARQAASL